MIQRRIQRYQNKYFLSRFWLLTVLVVSVVVFAFYSSNKVSAVDGYEACNPSGALWDPALVAYCIGASDGTSSAIKVYYKQTGDGDEGLIIEKKRQGDPLGFKFFDKITTKTGVKIDSDVISGQWYEYRMARPPDRDTPIDIKVGPVTGYADTTPPVISMSPDSGEWSNQAREVTVVATDDVKLSQLRYVWDAGSNVYVNLSSGCIGDTNEGKRCEFKTYSPTIKPPDHHALTVTASDAAPNTTTRLGGPYKYNTCPIAYNHTWIVDQDSENNRLDFMNPMISLDGDSDARIFTVAADSVTNGIFKKNELPYIYFTPNSTYYGAAGTFVFQVSDGICPASQTPPSNPDQDVQGTVTIQVRKVNRAPTCGTKSVSTPQNTAVSIALPGADSDTPVLTWTATPDSGFYHGTLGTVTGNTVTYTPGTNDTRTVSFAYTVSDGDLSCTSSVVVSITADNPPVAIGQTINIKEDDPPKTITLQATDTDSDELTFSTIAPPARGSLSALTQNARAGTNDSATIVYTPETDYAGADITFKFKANDTKADSNEATITLHFTSENDAPSCFNTSIIAQEDVRYDGRVSATDIDTPLTSLIFSIVTAPSKGSATISAGGSFSYTYTHEETTPQTDSFTYRVYDGEWYSPCTVNISGNPVDDLSLPPTSATITSDTSPATVGSKLTCSATPVTPADPDGPSPVIYQYSFEKNFFGSWVLLRGWTAGAVYTCSSPDCAKTAQVRCGARGVANNGAGVPGSATYSSTVTIENSPPTAPVLISPPNAFPNAGTTVTHTWTGSLDLDGDDVTYRVYRCKNVGCSLTSVAALKDTSITSSGLDAPSTYYWKVDAYDGSSLVPSETWSFDTASAADFIVTLAPQSGALTTVPKDKTVPFIATVTAKNGWAKDVILSFISVDGSPALEAGVSLPTCASYPGGKCEVNFNVKSSAFGVHSFKIRGTYSTTPFRESAPASFTVLPWFQPKCSPSNASISTEASADISVYPPGFLLTKGSTFIYKVKPQDGYYVSAWSESCAGIGETDSSKSGAEKSCTLTMSEDRFTCPTVKAKEGVSLIIDPSLKEAPVTTAEIDGKALFTITARGEGAFTGPVDFTIEDIPAGLIASMGSSRCSIATKGGTCSFTLTSWARTVGDHSFTVRAKNTTSGIDTTASGNLIGRWQLALSANPADGNGDGIVDNTVTANPVKVFYTDSDSVTVRANPGAGYAVQQFSGSCTGVGTVVSGSSARTCAVVMNGHKKVIADFIRDSAPRFAVSLRTPTIPYDGIGASISGFFADVTKAEGFSGDVTVQGEVVSMLVSDGTAGEIGIKFPDTSSKICRGAENCSYPMIVYDARPGAVSMMSGYVRIAGVSGSESGSKREESATQAVGFLPVVTVTANPADAGDIVSVSQLAGQIVKKIGTSGYLVTPLTILSISAQPRAGYLMTSARYTVSPGSCETAPISGTRGYSCVYKDSARTFPIDRNGIVTAQFTRDTASLSVSIARDATRVQRLETDGNIIVPIGGIAYYTVTVKKDPTVTEQVSLNAFLVSGPGTPGFVGSLNCATAEFDSNGECKKSLIVNANTSGDIQSKVQITTASGTPGPQPVNSNTVLTHAYELLTLTRDGVDGCSISQGATQLLGPTETNRWYLVPRGTVALSASALSGVVFGGWTEGCAGISSSCWLTIPPNTRARIQCANTSAPSFNVSITGGKRVPKGGTARYTVNAIRSGGSTFTGTVNFSFTYTYRDFGGPEASDPTYTISWSPAGSCEMTVTSSTCSTELAITSVNGFGKKNFIVSATVTKSGTTYAGTCASCVSYIDVTPTITLAINNPAYGYINTDNPKFFGYNASPWTTLVNRSWFVGFSGYKQKAGNAGWMGCTFITGDSCYIASDKDYTVIALFEPAPGDLCSANPSARCNEEIGTVSDFARCLTIPYKGEANTSLGAFIPASHPAGHGDHRTFWHQEGFFSRDSAGYTNCNESSPFNCTYRRLWSQGPTSTNPSMNLYYDNTTATCTESENKIYNYVNGGFISASPWTSITGTYWPTPDRHLDASPSEWIIDNTESVAKATADTTCPVGSGMCSYNAQMRHRSFSCHTWDYDGTLYPPPLCTVNRTETPYDSYPAITFRCAPYPTFSLVASRVHYQDTSPYAYVGLYTNIGTESGAWPVLGGCVVSMGLWRSVDGGVWETVTVGNSQAVGSEYQEKRVKFKLRACSSGGCAEAVSNELLVNNPPLCPSSFGTSPVTSESSPLSPFSSATVEFSYSPIAIVDPVVDPDGVGVTSQIKLVDPVGVAKNIACSSVGSRTFNCSINPSKYADLKYRNSSGTGPYGVYVDPADRLGMTRTAAGMSTCKVGDIYTKIAANPTLSIRAQKPGTTEVKDIAFFGDTDAVEYVMNYSFASGTGIDTAQNTQIYVDLPVPASNISSVFGGSPTYVGNRMTLSLGNVVPGAVGEVKFTLSIPVISTDVTTLTTQSTLTFDADCVPGGTSCSIRVAAASVGLYRRTGAYFTTTGGSIYSKSSIMNLEDPSAIRKPIGLYYIISDGQIANVPVDPKARVRQYAGQQFGVPTDTSSITKLGKLPIDDMINNTGGKYDVTTVACGASTSNEGVNCSASELFSSAGMTVSSTADSDTVTLNSAKGKVIVVPDGLNFIVRKHLVLANALSGKSGAVTVIVRRGNMNIYHDITYSGAMIDADPKRVASVAWIVKNGNVVVYAEPTAWNSALAPCPGYKGSRWCALPDGWPEVR